MDPNQQVAPLSFTQLEKIDNMLTQHGEQIKKKNKQLYHILTALCDTTHTGGTLQKVEKMADKTQSQRKENIIEMPTNDDGRKSARHALMHTHKVELVALLKQYKAYERPHKPHARTLAAFKSQLGVHDDGENADFYTIALGEHITKQYEIRGKDKIFFAGQNDFLAFFHDIRGKTIPASIKAIRDELSTSMRIIKEKTKKGYTVRFLLDSSEETWDLQCTVTRDKQVYQRTYQLSYTDLKKMIDGLIGKDITYTHMLSPIKAKGSSSSLLNQEEDDDEEDEDED